MDPTGGAPADHRSRRAAGWGLPMVVVCGWLALVWFWKPSALTLTVDDSFYALKTAVNASRGRGLTFDGIHPTNGFHPLWMAWLVPLAAVFGSDMDTFVRVVLSVQLALVLLGCSMLLRPFVKRSRTAPSVCVALLFSCFYFMKIFVNGLESALEFACMGLATARLGRLQSKPAGDIRASDSVELGLLAAATTLARLSAVAFAVPWLVLHVLGNPSGRASDPSRASPENPSEGVRFARYRRAALAAAAFLVPLGAYAFYNVRSFGHFLPVNAAIKGVAEWDGIRTFVAGLAKVGIVAVVGALLLHRYGGERTVLRRLALPIVVYAAAESAYDSLVRGILVPEIWYLVPEATLLLLVASEVAEIVAPWGVWIAAAGVPYAVLMFLTWSTRVRPLSYSPYVAARATGEWIREHTDSHAIVAGWDCGIAGAWSQRDFVNLDGLINSWAYREDVLEAGRVQEFIEPAGQGRIDYLAQPLALSQFEGDGPVLFKDGVDLSAWHVLRADCYEFRSILGSGPEEIVSLVLSLRTPGPPLGSFVGGRTKELCRVSGG